MSDVKKIGPPGTHESFEPPKKNKMKMSANFINTFARELRGLAKKESGANLASKEITPTNEPSYSDIFEENI